MNLNKLKEKATAAELCLIEKVDLLIRDELGAKYGRWIVEYLLANPLPDFHQDRTLMKDYTQRLSDHLEKQTA